MSDNQYFTSNFEAKVVSFIEKHQLLEKSNTYLVGISGGPDSTALAILLTRLNFKIALAHCNFQLRGKEADDDEDFVKNLSKSLKTECFVKKFDTEKEKRLTGESIQMVARRLRYVFFEDLLLKHNFSGVIVGSTINDQLETILLNLTKGTGISGLTGMRPKKVKVIRPFLSSRKEEVLAYLKELNEPFRIDESNKENKYQRNLIRNKVVPELLKINPSLFDSFNKTITHLNDDELAATYAVKEALKKCTAKNDDKLVINIEKLLEYEFHKKVLWEVANQHHYSSDQSIEIIKLLNSASGKKVTNSNYECLKDRNHLVFYPISKNNQIDFKIISIPFKNHFLEIKKVEKPTTLKTPADQIYIDEHSVMLPLKLRTWKQGDKIIPFGMKGQKLVSDILIDQKLSVLAKENQLVLTNADGRIIWVLGLKFSEEFKVTSNTKNLVKIKALTSLL